MRSSLVIISSYVRMPRRSLAENASHGMGERANAARASSAERASQRKLATSTVGIVDFIVTPPLQRRREIGGHAVSLEVTEERVRASEAPKDFHHRDTEARRRSFRRVLRASVSLW